jgi:hypothetical protein
LDADLRQNPVLVTGGNAFFSTGIAGSRVSLHFPKQQRCLSVSQETGFSFLLQGGDAFPQVVGGITNGLSSRFSPIKIGIFFLLGLDLRILINFTLSRSRLFHVENLDPNPVVNLTFTRRIPDRQILIFFIL